MISTESITSDSMPRQNPKECNTETFFDREVELLICRESKNCRYKYQLNRMTICTCKDS